MTRWTGLRSWFVRVLMVAALGLGALASGATTSFADPEATGFVVLMPGALELQNGSFVGTLTLANGTPETLTVSVTVVLLGTDGAVVPTAIALDPDRGDIRAGGSGQVTITANEAGTGTVVVLARNASGEAVSVSEQPLSTAAPPTPVPSVSEWDFTHDGWVGGVRTRIPLSSPCDDDWAGKTVVLAGDGASVEAAVSCTAGVLDLTSPQMGPGTYKGTLKLSADDQVAITLTRTRPMLLATLLALLGAALALVANSQLKLIQPIRLGRKRQQQADQTFREALAQEENQNPTRPDGVSGAIANATPRGAADLEPLERLYGKSPWSSLVAAVPTAKLASLAADLDSIEKDGKLLNKLAESLTRLAAARQVLTETDDLDQGRKYPLLRAADAYFEGSWEFRGEASITDIDGLSTVLSILNDVQHARCDVTRMSPSSWDDFQRSKAFSARQSIEELELAIRSADDSAILLATGIVKDLHAVQATIAALRPALPGSQAEFMSFDSETSLAGPLSATPAILGWPGEQIKGALEFLQPKVRTAIDRSPNWLLFAVALTAALLVGYTALYAGKPWGSWLDMVAAVVYGATTLAASLSLSTYFGDFAREPRKKPTNIDTDDGVAAVAPSHG